MMSGFPAPLDEQVTLANWRNPPFNRWAFHHVREIIPSADISNEPGDVLELRSDPIDEIGRVKICENSGSPVSVEQFLQKTSTDAIVIVYRGRIVFERYDHGMVPEVPHILMSVSKSLTGLLAGVLAERGHLDPDCPIIDLIGEIKGSAYEGATVRHLLDMRAGARFDEDYSARSGAIVEYRKATNWNPLQPGEAASDLRSFYRQMTERAGPHGGPFNYISPNTDLLGWAIERATGRRFADLMSELIWKPIGAFRSAYITVDRLGAPRCAGGLCATARDLARFGQAIVHGGRRDGREIVPTRWIDDVVYNGDAEAWSAGGFAWCFPGQPMHYRNQWYVLTNLPLLFALGIHGQYLFIDRLSQLVIAKVSSEAEPLDAGNIGMTVAAASAIRRFLLTHCR